MHRPIASSRSLRIALPPKLLPHPALTTTRSFVLPMHGHTVESLEAVLRSVDLSGFPIVTSDAERLLVGFASRAEMEALLRYTARLVWSQM
jgi:hypothetical protein